jgi:crossover junction endodeoxyribonuclease RuvC
MVVLGVDPSTVATGWGILDGDSRRARAVEYDVLRPPGRLSRERRLHAIHAGLAAIIDRLRPDVLVIESPFHHRNAKTALALGEVRGVVLLAATQRDLPFEEYSAMEIKRSAVGYGAAEKEQVAHMMARILGLPETPEPDAADALATAWCHLSRAARPALHNVARIS